MDTSPAKRRKVDHADANSLQPAIDAGIHQPTAFVLETEELLKEAKLDYGKAMKGSDELLHRLKQSIEQIEPHGPIPIAEATSKLEDAHQIRIPFPEPTPPSDCPYKVSFALPAQFNVVGSYVSRTMVKSQSDRAVDMILVIPEEILQEKDYLDFRYFYKRAYFLARAAASLKQEFQGEDVQLSFELLNGNPLLPILSVTPGKGQNETKQDGEESSGQAKLPDYRIRLIPCAPDGYFPKQKLAADASLIRKSGGEERKTSPVPTPFYNSTLKADGSYVAYLRLLRQTEKTCSAFKDACLLGRIWLQQRGLGGGIAQGGFGHFEWAALMALLLQTGGRKGQALLSSSLNSTQLFKAMIQFLAETSLTTSPCILGPAKEQKESIREAGPVIYDSGRQLNLVFKMSPWSSALLQHQARWTHNLLADSLADDHFTPTFITKVGNPAHMFDLSVRLSPSEALDSLPYDARGKSWALSAKVHDTIKKALGNRARMVHLTNQATSTRALDSSPSSAETSILVGVLFDPANMSRQVDHGPPAEDKKEAQRFRQFWGEKSELRRFKDGSILETLIWTSASPAELCEEIIRYIVGRHLRRVVDVRQDMVFVGRALPSLLPVAPTDSSAFDAARRAFEAFERDVRDLEDLPLHVRQLAPICPELRLASVKAPLLDSTKTGPRPMEVVISFEASGKWPDNLAAIQRTKIAFLLRIRSLLEEAKPDVTTHLGLEDPHQDIENLAFLDIIYDTGAVFRLRIHSDLEETLLDRRAKDKTLDQHIRAESATLLSTFRRLYTFLPLHTQKIRTYATRFPALSPTIRLLKSWFDAHKLSIHFTPDLIELLALHVFLTPYPWDTPSSASTGFLRALQFLSRWDWRSEPLLIDTASPADAASDLGEPLSSSSVPIDRASAATRLEAWRKIDPAMNRTVLFVATNHDASGTAHTSLAGEPAPSKVVATRMTTLARSACRLVKDRGADIGLEPSARALFAPALGDYDVLIRLDRHALKACARTYPAPGDGQEEQQPGRPRFKNLDRRTGLPPLPQSAHPARVVVEQLRRAYAGPLLFFHGAEHDCVVGAIWNPQAQRRSFRVNLLSSYRPVPGGAGGDAGDEDDVVEVNQEGILAEIARIGGDLVEKIELPSSSVS